MTEPFITADRAVELVRYWAPRLGLEHWRIGVKVEDDGETSAAAWVSGPYDTALITVSPSPAGMARDDLHHHSAEIAVVHELIHLVNRNAHDEIRRVFREHVSGKARRVGWNRYDTLHEGTIERLARALVFTRHGLPAEMLVPVIGEGATA